MNMLLRPANLAAPISAPPPVGRPFRLKRRPEERVRVLGGEMDLVRPEEVMGFVAQKVAARERAIIANHNLHSLYLARRDARVQAFFRKADLIEVDSTPLIYWARLVGRPSRPFHRCTYLDWRDVFWPMAVEKGWRVFYLGAAPNVADIASERLMARHPGLQLGVRHGYFDAAQGSAENAEVVRQIADFAPDILFVGMGMPRQEAWIEENAEALPPCVMFSVGAAFDYEADIQIAAPRWMGRAGIEWLYRLLHDPRRLFTRYCVKPWWLLPVALFDLKQAVGRHFRKQPAAIVTRV